MAGSHHVVTVFAVTMFFGPHWDASRQRREQDARDEHAALMDGLVDDGFAATPRGGGRRASFGLVAERR